MRNIQPQVEFEINRGFLACVAAAQQNQPMVNKVSQLWQEIEAALQRLEKTQTWLAEKLDLSDNAITKWKKHGKISRDNAIRVSELLSVPLDKLLVGRAGNVVAETLDALPDENRQQVFEFILFQINQAEKVLNEKPGQYASMIERIKADMGRRKQADAQNAPSRAPAAAKRQPKSRTKKLI